jgi:hypothetical protein
MPMRLLVNAAVVTHTNEAACGCCCGDTYQ